MQGHEVAELFARVQGRYRATPCVRCRSRATDAYPVEVPDQRDQPQPDRWLLAIGCWDCGTVTSGPLPSGLLPQTA
jgi:hypothetical protein